MSNRSYLTASVRQELLDNSLRARAIIQDIQDFRGSFVELEALNETAREKFTAIRKCIDSLEVLGKDASDKSVLKEVERQREQLFSAQQAFRKFNVMKMLEIENEQKQQLFTLRPEATELRKRTTALCAGSKANRGSSLLMQHQSVTDRMQNISQHLFETTEKSAATLDVLLATRATIQNTQDELLKVAGSIKESRKLLDKYTRRERTDKILALFGLVLFLVSVVYIVSKRLF